MSTHARVLVVDDEPDMRTVLLDVFERAQFEPVAVAEGRSAMRALFEQRFDLVVLDIEMPDLNGFDVLERIREVSQVPVLFLTTREVGRTTRSPVCSAVRTTTSPSRSAPGSSWPGAMRCFAALPTATSPSA